MEYEATVGVGGAMGVAFIIIWLIIYLFFAFCLAKMAQKTGKPLGTSFIMAVIPIANIVLWLQISDKPIWWIILLFIPIVGWVISIFIWMAIAERLGRPGWWGIVIGLVPLVNLILILILAFGKMPAKATPASGQPTV